MARKSDEVRAQIIREMPQTIYSSFTQDWGCGRCLHPLSAYGAKAAMKVRGTLKKNSDFRRLYAKGKSAVTPYLVLYARPNRLQENRVGYTVSTKLGHAVVRNRVRRRLREIYRLNAPRLKQGYDLAVVARSRAVGCRYQKLDAAFLRACESLGLML